MQISLNNITEKFIEDSMSVSDLLKIKNFTFKMLIVKINNKLIKKEDFDSTFIGDNDEVAVIHLISGG
jgi:sulfur carrier protein